MNIDPRIVKDVVEWSDFMTAPLLPLSIFRRLDDPEKWQEWAYHLVQSQKIAAFNPPDPRLFDDWKEWAFRFNQVVPL